MLVKTGTPQLEAMKVTGHRDLRVLARYHVGDAAMQQAALARMPALSTPVQGPVVRYRRSRALAARTPASHEDRERTGLTRRSRTLSHTLRRFLGRRRHLSVRLFESG